LAPIRGGWIEFIPIDGALGSLRSAPIQPDGSFQATHVAQGRNVVRIVNPPASPSVERVFQLFYSPIRVDVSGERAIEIDLSRPATWGLTTRPDPARSNSPPRDPP
jgi:hypothetical protein